MRAIEIYNGWIPVPDSWGVPVNGLHDTRLNELLQLRADKKMLSINLSVTPPLESLSDDETSELITVHKEKETVPLQFVFNQYSPPTIVDSSNSSWHRTCRFPFRDRHPLSTTQ